VTIGSNVESIETNAFNCSNSLKFVTMNCSLDLLSNALEGNNNLITLTIGASITSFSFSGKSYRNKFESVIIGNSITSIDEYAFFSCSNLVSVTIPPSVTSIGKQAFQYCESLKSIVLGDTITTVGVAAFENCASLNSVTIGAGITSFSSNVFDHCDNLEYLSTNSALSSIFSSVNDKVKSLVIGDSIKTIRNDLLLGWKKLTYVSIGANVESIGTSACACRTLTYINISKNNLHYLSIDGVLFDKEASHLIQYPLGRSGRYIIPDGVTSIDADSFKDSSKLTSVIFGSDVTSIGSEAFYSCNSLIFVNISDSVSSIGNKAFGNCAKLYSVVYLGTSDPGSSGTFEGCGSLTKVCVPDYYSSDQFCGIEKSSLFDLAECDEPIPIFSSSSSESSSSGSESIPIFSSSSSESGSNSIIQSSSHWSVVVSSSTFKYPSITFMVITALFLFYF